MNSNNFEIIKNIVEEVKLLNIKELSQDIQYLKESRYNLSYPKVQHSIERVIHYLRKYDHLKYANELEEILIDSQRRINMHSCLIALIKELKGIKDINSDILDYIYGEYQGIIYNDETMMYKVKKMKKTTLTGKDASKLHSMAVESLLQKFNYRGNASVLLRENELEVTLLSTLLFSSNRAYSGKIDGFLSKNDDPILRSKLKDILESDYDNHTIQFLDEENKIADTQFENLDDLEKEFELTPEESLTKSGITEEEYEAIRLSDSIQSEFFTHNYNDEDLDLDDEDRVNKLAHYIKLNSSDKLHTRINYGANDALMVVDEVPQIDELLITRFIRNSLAHYRWRFVDNGYVHMWHKDETTKKIDFNIKIPVEILRRYIRFFIEEIFKDVKYLTVNDFNGNYPNEYLDMKTEDMIDDLIKKCVLRRRDKSAVLELANKVKETKCSFYTDEYSKKRAEAVLKYIKNNYVKQPEDIEYINEIIDNQELDYFIDQDLRGILDWLDENNFDLDTDTIELEMEGINIGYDLYFQSTDINVLVMDAIVEEYINPLMIDYALIADYSKIISRINPYDSGTDLDFVPVLPFEAQSRYIDQSVLVKTLLTTILTILFVHTEVDENLLENFNLSGVTFTRKGLALYKKDLQELEDSLSVSLEKKTETQVENIAKHTKTLEEATKKLEDLKAKGAKVTKIEKQQAYIDEIKEKIKRNYELITEKTNDYNRNKKLLEEGKKDPIKLYTGKQQYAAVRNSLAHGNLVIPDDLDVSNLDETILTIVDKDPERDNELTFDGKIKLSDLLSAYCKPEIMTPTFNLDTRFNEVFDLEEYTPSYDSKSRLYK